MAPDLATATPTTTIREATSADVSACVAMLLDFVAMTDYARHITPDPVVVERTMRWLLASGAIFVAEQDGTLIGMMGLGAVPHLLTGRLYASEVFWWMKPQYRGHGLGLLRAGEQWARDQGAEFLQMIAPTVRVGELYARLGYTLIETSYQKALRP